LCLMRTFNFSSPCFLILYPFMYFQVFLLI
jgi:hypothetical protein